MIRNNSLKRKGFGKDGERGRGRGRDGDRERRRPIDTGIPRTEMMKKRNCRFCQEKITEIDYKDTNRLKRYITEKGKIIPSRMTSTCAKHQRQLANAVRRARFIALLSHVGE